MIIDPLSASKFIAVYKALLLEIDRTTKKNGFLESTDA